MYEFPYRLQQLRDSDGAQLLYKLRVYVDEGDTAANMNITITVIGSGKMIWNELTSTSHAFTVGASTST